MASVASGLSVQVVHDFEAGLADEGPAGLVTREAWDELLAVSASNVVFLTWQWQSVWWRHFGGQEGCKLHLLAIRDEEGMLVGIAPLFIALEPLPPAREYQQGRLRPEGAGQPVRLVRIVGGVGVADYLDIIARPDMLAPAWDAVLDYLVSRREEWDLIDLHSIPESSPSRLILPQLVEERSLGCQLFPEEVCPVIELPADWDTYLMSLRKKHRHELRRKVRKLEGREDAHWYLVPATDRDALIEGTKTFIHLHRRSAPEKAEFMDERMAAYFLDIASTLAETGWIDLAIMEVDKQPAAAYFSFNYDGRIYLYNSGYEPKWAGYSAGIALLAYRIHKAILQGVHFFDFLRGDERYKYHLGGKDTFVYRALLTPTDRA